MFEDEAMADAPEEMPEAEEDESVALRWLAEAPSQANLVDVLDDADVARMGTDVKRETEIDRASRKPWFDAMEKALKLVEADGGVKNAPWKGASNVKYPLIMNAVMKFNAIAYPALVPPDDIVKCKTNGADPSGAKAARANRVAAHMSHQLRNTVLGWEEETDRMTMQVSNIGLMHRKVWFDPIRGRICVKMLKPGALIINDNVSSLEEAPRKSEEFELAPAQVAARVKGGLYRDGDWRSTEAGGSENDTHAPLEFIEQHRCEDLDGDGYPEPYIVTLHKASDTVVRVVANWRPADILMAENGAVVDVPPRTYYVDYHFLPSVSGGYHSYGFGLLLGDLSEAINAAINRINDAATMATLGSGWIGGRANLSANRKPFEPGEYRPSKTDGRTLREEIVERNVAPSPVMFQMLGLLIDAAREVSNVQDIQAQAAKSSQPATTTVALIEQGMAVYTAIFKRLHRSMRREFRLIAGINAEYLNPEAYAAFHDEAEPAPQQMPGQPPQMPQQPISPQTDYDLSNMDIEPVADPRAVSSPQKMAQAQLLIDMSEQGRVDPGAATKRVLSAANIPDQEELEPQQDPAQAEAMQHLQQLQVAQIEADLRAKNAEAVKTAVEAAKLEAEIQKVMAEAAKTMAEGTAKDVMRPLEMALTAAQALQARTKAWAEAANATPDARDSGRVEREPRDRGGLPGVGLAGAGIPGGGAEPLLGGGLVPAGAVGEGSGF